MTETYKQDRWQLNDLFDGFETQKVEDTWLRSNPAYRL